MYLFDLENKMIGTCSKIYNNMNTLLAMIYLKFYRFIFKLII